MKQKIKLTTLSPVCIKSGIQKKYYEFFVGKNKVYFLNQKEFLSVLKNTGIDIDFINLLSKKVFDNKKSESFDIKDVLKQNFKLELNEKLDKELLEEISHYSIKRKTINKGNSIDTIIRDIFYKPYIPGSSLKGAFRTGIYSVIFSKKIDNPKIKERYSKKVPWEKNGRFNSIVNNELIKDNILNFYKIDLLKKKISRMDAKNDFMRFIQISDAKLVNEDNSELVNFEVYGMKSKKALPQFEQEIIPAGTEFEFYIKIDHERFNKWKSYFSKKTNLKTVNSFPEDIDDFFYFSKAFSDTIIEKEKKYWKNNECMMNFYNSIENEENLIRIGNGSGAHSVTIVNQLDKIGVKIHGKEGLLNYPKTRKVVKNLDNSIEPFGWCKLEII